MRSGLIVGKLYARVTNWLLTLRSLVFVLFAVMTCFVLCNCISL